MYAKNCLSLLFILGNFTGCDWSGDTEETTLACCSSANPCGLFEGHCDGDDECAGNLLCGSDNCLSFFHIFADCCIEP